MRKSRFLVQYYIGESSNQTKKQINQVSFLGEFN